MSTFLVKLSYFKFLLIFTMNEFNWNKEITFSKYQKRISTTLLSVLYFVARNKIGRYHLQNSWRRNQQNIHTFYWFHSSLVCSRSVKCQEIENFLTFALVTIILIGWLRPKCLSLRTKDQKPHWFKIVIFFLWFLW